MDKLTIQHANKLFAKFNNYSSFSNNEYELENYTLFVIQCECKNDFPIKFVTQEISMLGYDSNEINKKLFHLKDFFPQKDFLYFLNSFKKYSEENAKDFLCETRFKDSNNYYKNILTHVDIIYKNHKPDYIECIMIDITDDKETDNSFKRIEYIINNNDLVFLQLKALDDDKYYTNFVSNNINYYGYSENEIISNNICIFDMLYPEDKDSYYTQLKKATENGKTYLTNTFRILNKQSNIVWVVLETLVHKKNNNIFLIEVIIHDVSDQKEYNLKLFESQKCLNSELEHNQLITEILKLLQVTDDYSMSLKIILQKLSNFANVSMLNIYIPSYNDNAYKNYFYNNNSCNFAEKEVSIELFKNKYPNILERLTQYGTAYCDAFGTSQNCKEEFKKDGNFSYLIYTIPLKNNHYGFISIIDENCNRTWDNEIISLISDISQIISGLFHRFSIQKELSIAKDTFQTVLDNIDTYVCVTTIDTDKIIFTNKKFNDNFSKNNLGKNYWELLNIKKEEYIQNYNNYSYNSMDKPRFYEAFCPLTNQWLDITEIAVVWNDGNLVKLFTINNITEKVEYEKLIEKQAHHDQLTELPNRRMLEKEFNLLLNLTIAENGFGYILFLDLDNFKNINDGLGHQYGDALLHNIADFLKSISPIENHVYRFGGDEFVILIPYKIHDKINDIITNLFDRFQKKWNILDTNYYCTMSMGIAKFPYDGTNLNDIMKKVDMAMYSAKKQGKNRIIHYQSKIGFESIRSIELERYLRESISNSCHDFNVFYQPLINANTKKLEGAEALLRWSCESLGSISPVEFIPLAEDLGLIIELGDYVIRKACTECKRWINLGYKDFKMNINLSVEQLIQPDIIQKICNIINEIDVPFNNIAFEVTESLAITDMKKTKEVLNSISDLGIEISLDDFGTGYSSLNNIKNMPLNVIKIDKSFIDDLIVSASTEIFVKTIINLAHALNMKVCAEGVEEENQYLRLIELEADIIQGYYFGRPIPAKEFEKQFNML